MLMLEAALRSDPSARGILPRLDFSTAAKAEKFEIGRKFTESL